MPAYHIGMAIILCMDMDKHVKHVESHHYITARSVHSFENKCPKHRFSEVGGGGDTSVIRKVLRMSYTFLRFTPSQGKQARADKA